MRTEAYFELQSHAYSKLWPFNTGIDFWTETAIFQGNILLVIQEAQKNRFDQSGEGMNRYAKLAAELISDIRSHINRFFESNADYGDRVKQIESQETFEDPESELTLSDSLSETELKYPPERVGLYLNKICLWAFNIFQSEFLDGGESPAENAGPSMSASSKARLLLLKYTGLYKHFSERYDGKTQKALAETIGAVIGSGTANVVKSLSLIDQPFNPDKNNPYSKDAILFTISHLEKLDEDVSELRKIYSRKFEG
jgi:hypothetical protein